VAASTLERIVVIAPDQADAWFQLSLLRQDRNDLAGAAIALRQVLRIDPGRAEAHVNLGIVLQDSGRADDAMQEYGRAYRLREDTFGRIAHALSTPSVGRLWLDLDALRDALRAPLP
jgi:tetratricopeptide (TPR) repeat protein